MALKKKIKHANGVELNYHRIALLSIDTNSQTTMLIRSYIDEEGRNYEKRYANGEIAGEPSFPYTVSEYRSFDYDEKMNIENAYELLKQQPDFKDAEDI